MKTLEDLEKAKVKATEDLVKVMAVEDMVKVKVKAAEELVKAKAKAAKELGKAAEELKASQLQKIRLFDYEYLCIILIKKFDFENGILYVLYVCKIAKIVTCRLFNIVQID